MEAAINVAGLTFTLAVLLGATIAGVYCLSRVIAAVAENSPSQEAAQWLGYVVLAVLVIGGMLATVESVHRAARAEATAACPTVEAS